MFFRTKKAGPFTYLLIVESVREGKGVRQRVLATLGRVGELEESGQLARLLQSVRLGDYEVSWLRQTETGSSTSSATNRP